MHERCKILWRLMQYFLFWNGEPGMNLPGSSLGKLVGPYKHSCKFGFHNIIIFLDRWISVGSSRMIIVLHLVSYFVFYWCPMTEPKYGTTRRRCITIFIRDLLLDGGKLIMASLNYFVKVVGLLSINFWLYIMSTFINFAQSFLIMKVMLNTHSLTFICRWFAEVK
jgi:hypothetical protein